MQVNDHILAGMMSIYTVENANGTEASLAPALPTQGAPAARLGCGTCQIASNYRHLVLGPAASVP